MSSCVFFSLKFCYISTLSFNKYSLSLSKQQNVPSVGSNRILSQVMNEFPVFQVDTSWGRLIESRERCVVCP